MAFIRCERFFFCLSLRYGVWILALLTLLIGGAGATGGWLGIKMTAQNKLPFADKISLFAQAGAFSFTALVALYGFISGLAGSRGAVFLYSRIVALNIVVTLLGLGGAAFFAFSHVSEDDISTCVDGSTSQLVVQFCTPGLSLLKALPIILFGASLPLLSYAFIIALNYTEKSVTDEAELWSSSFNKLTPGGFERRSMMV